MEQTNLRIDPGRFRKELLRDRRLVVGRLDAGSRRRISTRRGSSEEFDPSNTALQGAWTAMFLDYVRNELKWESDLHYDTSGNVRPVDLRPEPLHGHDRAAALDDGAESVPARCSSAAGYYDMATPFHGIEINMWHLAYDPVYTQRVQFGYYESGHMMYIRPSAHKKLKDDIAKFITSTENVRPNRTGMGGDRVRGSGFEVRGQVRGSGFVQCAPNRTPNLSLNPEPSPEPRTPNPRTSRYTNQMAVRRGVWLVLVLIFLAVVVSAAGLVFVYTALGQRAGRRRATRRWCSRSAAIWPRWSPPGVLGQFFESPPTVRTIVDALRKAKVDRARNERHPPADGRVCALGQSAGSPRRDRRLPAISGKPIVAYLEYGGEQEFYLATACDKVFLMPTSSLDLTGIASYELFLRGTLDKIGAYPDGMHIGDYKTALNNFTEHTYTPAHREMAESLNTDLYEQLVRGIADGRHKSEAEVRALIDHGPFLPEDALKAGLVDDLAYEDQTRRQGEARGRAGRTTCQLTTTGRCRPPSLGLDRGPRIAVIYAVRRHRERQEQLRLAERHGRRVRHHHRLPAHGARATRRSRRSCCGSTAPADPRSPRT